MGAFRTKARAVELLGRKQIRDSVTALAEIMKNSYDADAQYLRVDFLTKDISSPCIVICDTGEGMSKEDLEDKWLVLGTPSKLENKKKTTQSGRAVMGEKGIGRLAISRLGQQMWMFTKKTDTEWNILYINWNIFENPDLYIQDIEIPVLYHQSLEELSELVEVLKDTQMENLSDSSWKIEKNRESAEMIRKQIVYSQPDLELIIDFCNIIANSGRQQGTVIISMNLNDDWERYLDKTTVPEDDMLAARNYNRLNSFMSDFAANKKDFSVELFHNEEPLVFTAGFNEQDYELYDMRIEGYVEHGIFQGSINARNGDSQILEQCNTMLKRGISVTSGIKNWEKDDCGRYHVKLCHFEMDKKNTGLTSDEWETIKSRMDRAGGIGVYRDGVRVLPYGEPDNDFLELEERRSRSATYYLFSHRNMFGRIDITSSDNPHLEDKSSREGFIENQYYSYFIKTLQNLLIKIAVDFAGDMNKSSYSLRKSYLLYNNAEDKRKKELEAFEKEQKKLFKEDKKRVQLLLKRNPDILNTFARDFLEKMLNFNKECMTGKNVCYEELLNSESRVKAFLYEEEGAINKLQEELHIYINERVQGRYPEDILNRIDDFNDELQRNLQKLQSELNETCQNIRESIRFQMEELYNLFLTKTGVDPIEAISSLKEHKNNTCKILHKLENETLLDVLEKHAELTEKAQRIENPEQDIQIFRTNLEQEIKGSYGKIEKTLLTIENQISDMDFTTILGKMQDMHNAIDQEEEELYQLSEHTMREIRSRFESLNDRLDVMIERFSSNDQKLMSQLIAQNNELKQQNDMYADLANLGMAAEIVSHELNQLFNNVYDAINQLNFQGISRNGKYYLKQIDMGFRAISDRMSQMSPMYRSRNLYKKKINIYELLEDLYRFFENRFAKQEVDFINCVPKDLELKLSLSKIYPVMSNLVYNSMYWVADKQVRQILFHYVESENALYVEDSGDGISVRNKERVFQPFFSLKKNGRGLGLAITKNVLESQGHQIEVVTESEHKKLEGACFRIIFSAEVKV